MLGMGNPYILLVGMQIGEAIVEIIVAFFPEN